MLNKSNFNRFMLRNCFLLGTVCAGLFYNCNVNAKGYYYGGKSIDVNGILIKYGERYNDANTGVMRYELEGISLSDEYSYDSHNGNVSINIQQIMPKKLPVIEYSGMGETWSSNFSEFKKSISGLKSYYTDINYDSATKTLTFSDKTINQSTLDQALQDAGIADMSVYAKTADVYGKSEVYTKDEADGKFLTSHQDISGKANVGDSYTKAESDGKYATKSALNEYIKSSEIYDYIDYVAPKAITPTRDAMKAWQDLSNHGKYDLTTTSTGATNEKSIKIGTTTYFFTQHEVNDEMNQILNQLIASGVGVTTTGASSSDYVFKKGSTYYKFDTSTISDSNFKVIDSNAADYTYNKTIDDGSTIYYKVIGNRTSDARGSNVYVDGYYEGQINNSDGYTAGGAISTTSTIPLIEADFISNKTAGYGGAMSLYRQTYNAYDGTDIYRATVTTITGDFINNSASKSGGAIYEGNIDTLIGNFSGNTAGWDGGAIIGTIDKIYADFNNNIAGDRGGAIYRGNSAVTNILKGNFIGNQARDGGAIYNDFGTMNNITGNFKHNGATRNGGAIYSGGTIGLLAQEQDIIFYNNTDSTGYNDIYDENKGTFNLNATINHKIDFGGSIRNVKNLNINNSSSTANRGGDYVFNNMVDAGVNLYNGANVKLANIKQADGTTSYGVINTAKKLTVDNVAGSNIDMRNNHIDTNTVGGLTLGSNLGLGIDTSLRRHSTSTSDKLISTSAATGDGKMIINAINLTNSSYGEGDSMKVSIADDKTKGKIAIADDILDNITGATNYYTKVEYDEDTGDLVFTDKLVNKSTLDQALQDAGIGDMSIYAKTADVYDNVYTKSQTDDKFATKESLGSYVTSESLGTTLGGYVTTGGLNTALTPYAKSSDVAETYATKDSITDMLTKTEAGSTYATKTSVYTKDEANETFAVKGSSYTKSEIDETLGGYVTTGGLNTALTPYAKSSDVADTYATKEALTTGLGNKVDTSDFNEYKTTVSDTYATKSSLNDYAKTSDLSDYAKSSDISDMLTKTEAGTTYATKNELSSYAKSSDVANTYATKEALTTGLGGKVDTSAFNEYKTEVNNTYAKSGDVYSKNDMNTKLGGYVKSDDLSTTLSDYAKTEDLGVYAKTADIESNYATKEALNDYATKASLNDYVKSDALDGAINSKLTDYAKTSDLSDYAKTSDLGSYVKSSDLDSTLSGYAKTSDISDMLTKTEAETIYATKDELGNKMDTSAFNEYKTAVSDTYATKDALNNGLNAKANQSDLTALQGTVSDLSTTVAGKANQSDLTALQGTVSDLSTTVAGKANQSDLEALQTTVAGKANQSDLTALQGTVSGLSSTVSGLETTVSDLSTTVAGKANQSDLTALQGTVSDLSTTVAGKANQSDLEALQTTVAGKANQSDLTALQGTVSGLSSTVSGLETTVSDLSTTVAGKANQSDLEALQTTVAGKANQSDLEALQTTVAGKANQSDLTALQGTVSGLSTSIAGKANQSDLEALQTTVADKANAADVYTKDEADNKYATQNAISDMLTKTEAGNTYATQSAFNDYKTSNDNAVSALTGKMTQAETDISDIKGSAVMSSGITAEKVAAYEGYAALIDAKQDALTTEQMAVLNSGITAADIATVQTANARLDAMDTTVSDLSADFGDVADFSNSKTGNLKNDVPSSSKQNASTVTKAIANMDATIGQIHGLAAKVGVENGGANLGQNTTVEEHLTSLAGSIGNRTHYTQQNYIKNNQTVAQSLDNLDIAVGSMRRDFASAQIANEARFNDIEHNINHLENKMEKGLAANNALAALKPLSSTYQTQLSAAMGGYENNQAFAIGGFHYVTEKVLLNTGVAYGGNNSMSYNVGVTFGF